MKPKKRYIARLDEVTITRRVDSVEIQYKEAGVPGTSLSMSPEVSAMTDEAILALYNDMLRAQAMLAAEH